MMGGPRVEELNIGLGNAHDGKIGCPHPASPFMCSICWASAICAAPPRLARAFCDAGAEVLVLSGGMPVADVDFGPARIQQLPPCLAADAAFSVLLDEQGRAIDSDWKDRRRDSLLRATAGFQPDVLVIEMYPFGRRQFRFELLPLLYWAQNAKLLVASSVRDILVDKGRDDRVLEAADLVRRYFDLVLVHGDAALVPFERTFPRAQTIADRLHYTGYVVEKLSVAPAADRSDGEVLVSAGGGAVGGPLVCGGACGAGSFHLEGAALAVCRRAQSAGGRFRAAATGGRASIRASCVDRFRSDFTEPARQLPCVLEPGWVQHGDGIAGAADAGGDRALCRGAGERAGLAGASAGRTRRARCARRRQSRSGFAGRTLTRRAQAGALPIALNLDGGQPFGRDRAVASAARNEAQHGGVGRSRARMGSVAGCRARARPCGGAMTMRWRRHPRWRNLQRRWRRRPLALAVIPASPDRPLQDSLGRHAHRAGRRRFVLQHGIAHLSHAATGAKNGEFPATRPHHRDDPVRSPAWPESCSESLGRNFYRC